MPISGAELPQVTVIGIGNIIMTDDGVGLAILDELVNEQREGVAYVHGGTSGMEILPDIQDATKLLIIDGIHDPKATPGEVQTLFGDQIPRLQKSSLSPHQVGLIDLLAAARLLGSEPEEVALVGVVAQDVSMQREHLTEPVAAAVPEAVAAAQKVIDGWL